MKWNGIVSQLSHTIIATTLAAANRTQPISTRSGRRCLRGREPISHIAYRLDRIRAELLAQPADAHLDDVRTRVEVVAPDGFEELFAADDLVRMADEMVEEPELAVSEA